MILLEKREYSIEELENIIAESRMSDNQVLVSIKWEEGRNSPEIEESFMIDKTFWEEFQPKIINKDFYFGDIFGKHSNISGTISESEIRVIENQESILNFIKNNPSKHKYNYSFLSKIIEAYNDGEDAFGVSWDEFILEEEIKILKNVFLKK